MLGKINSATVLPFAREVIRDTTFSSLEHPEVRAFIVDRLRGDRLPDSADLNSLAVSLQIRLLEGLVKLGVHEEEEIAAVDESYFSDNPLLAKLLRRVKDRLALQSYVDRA